MIDINQWIEVLTRPVKVFSKHKTLKLKQALVNVAVAGVIAGVIAALSNIVAVMFIFSQPYYQYFMGSVIYAALAPIFTVPVFGVIGWLVFSWIVDFVAKASKKKSNFEHVASILSVLMPPIMVLGSIAMWLPFAGSLLRTLVSLYGLYLTAIALNHYYSLGYDLWIGSKK